MRKLIFLVFFLTAYSNSGLCAEEAVQPAYRVIVNAKSTVDALDRRSLADLFLKKIRRWPENSLVMPVDLRPDAPARQSFTESVLNRSVGGVKNYWQQLIFSGRDVPPPELRSDDEVIQYVLSNPGSIGYISAAAPAGNPGAQGVKIVGIR